MTSGAIGTPKIMMLSGVGPAAHLREHGIDVVHDLPGVGENLNDHFGIDIVAELKGHDSLDKYNKPHWAAWAGLQYAAVQLRSGDLERGRGRRLLVFRQIRAAVPDLQFHFLAGAGAEAGVPSVPAGSSGITLNSYTLRPKSRGTVRLRSADPARAAGGRSELPADPDDLKTSAEGREDHRRRSSASPRLQKYIRRIRLPG